MKNLISKFTDRSNPLFRDQRGITGIETAIVLIAFVVVSSVFASAALSTGLFTYPLLAFPSTVPTFSINSPLVP